MPEATLVGKLLVANPRLTDPNFDRTVVLVLVHGEDGAEHLVHAGDVSLTASASAAPK